MNTFSRIYRDEEKLSDVLNDKYNKMIALCFNIVDHVLSLSGLANLEDPINYGGCGIDHNLDDCMLVNINCCGVIYISNVPMVKGVSIGKRIKTFFDPLNLRRRGAFMINIDGSGPIECFAYDDWTDPKNPVLISTGFYEEYKESNQEN
jgi:hypothetical protein